MRIRCASDIIPLNMSGLRCQVFMGKECSAMMNLCVGLWAVGGSNRGRV